MEIYVKFIANKCSCAGSCPYFNRILTDDVTNQVTHRISTNILVLHAVVTLKFD